MSITNCFLRLVACVMFICFICPVLHSQHGYAFGKPKANTIQGKKNNELPVNTVEKKPLFIVLKELNQTKGVYFLYSNQLMGDKMVNVVTYRNEDVERILEAILKNSGLKYKKINAKTFVIVAEEEEKKSSRQASQSLNFATEANESVSYKYNNSYKLQKIITGTVSTAGGVAVADVSVAVKGTNRGTRTNTAGVYSIEADKGEVLVFSSVGFGTLEVRIADQTEVNVELSVNNQQLNEVVVTALGITRKSKSLTYATQQLSGSELSTVKDINVINGLAGKAAGVQINRSASGIGGSARVVLRGNKSTRENQPLYVIDGIPLSNSSPAQPSDVWGQSSGEGSGGRDGGDGISNINPEDIESINILKGASAAALYGSAAANGVILITTKKGKAGQANISFSTNLTLESPMLKPQLQYSYGQTTAPTATTTGTPFSWGAKTNAPDHVANFFKTGTTWTNALSFSGGNQMAQTYFSYSNTANKGILPTSTYNRHTLNLRQTLKLLNDKLSIDGNIIFLSQNAKNRPVSGMYYNPLTGLYLMPRGLSFKNFENNFEYASPARNGLPLQNWWNINSDKGFGGDDNQQNPFWALKRNQREDSRERAFTSLTFKYQLTPWITLQTRGSFDRFEDRYELKSFAGTQSVLAGSNGRYTWERSKTTQLYGDIIATANKDLSDQLSFSLSVGSSISDLKANDRVSFDALPTEGQGLEYANKFVVNNIRPSALVQSAGIDRKQTQSVFASGQIGLNDNLFLDLTGRNDWSSSFAFTPTMRKGYFYYSAGLTAVISDMLSLPEFFTFAKVRISYAQVGNDIPSYITSPPAYNLVNRLGSTRADRNTKVPLPGLYLKPEDNRSFEIGTEMRFLESRVGIDFTWYKNNNFQQYIETPAPLGSGFSNYYLNLGNIQNTGIEGMLTLVPYSQKNVKWTSSLNFSANKNKVVKLSDPNIPGAGPDNYFVLTGFGVNMFASFIQEGGRWGDIYANKRFLRDAAGSVIVEADGTPKTENVTGQGMKLGNPNPTFSVGWNNTFDFKGLYISFLIDGRFGGKVMSVTEAVLDQYGVSKRTAAARDAGGVSLDAVTANGQKYTGKIDPQKYFTAIGGRAGLGEAYLYDASNIRLRELAIGYQLPSFVKFIKEARISLVGRNLFFIKNDVPFDPDLSMSTANGLQGVDVFGLPSTRSIGLNVKFTF